MIKKKKKKTSTVSTERPVNTKTSTVQINNNGYIGKKKKKKNSVQIENLGKKKKESVLYRLKTPARRTVRERGERKDLHSHREKDETKSISTAN